MLSRGIIIGKLIDDLANLKVQIELRNAAQLYDLTKICEDFFKDVLNLVFRYNLKNLNEIRSNYPGLDLGDKKIKTAFQITSTKTSQKVNHTLSAIIKDREKRRKDGEEIDNYNKCIILIIGDKQKTYDAIDEDLAKEVGFNKNQDIWDINDIIKKIAILDINILFELMDLFKKDFSEISIEFEKIEKDGSFKSSIYNYVEEIPNKIPNNLIKLEKFFDEDFSIKEFKETYKQLSVIPRAYREYLCLIIERTEENPLDYDPPRYEILSVRLAAYLRISEKKLLEKMFLLETKNLVILTGKHVEDDYDREQYVYRINDEFLSKMMNFVQENEFSVRNILMSLDFSILEGVEEEEEDE